MAKEGEATLIPRLRFPEFRNAERWKAEPMGDLFEITSSKRVHQSEWTDAGVPFYRARELVALHDGQSITPLHISEELYERNAALSGEIREGHLLVTGVGSIGVPYLVKKNDRFYFKDGNIIWLKNSGSTLIGEFLHLLYCSDIVQKQITTMAGIGTVGTYTIDNAKRTVAIFPPVKHEQKKIANCLTSLDEVIAAQGRKVGALKAHKRGLMQQLFPREGKTRPRLRFPEFRNAPEWKLGKASDIVDVLQGYGFPERLQGGRDGEFPFYKVSDISACVDGGSILLDEANNHIDADVLEELRAKPMPVGATVFAKIGEAIRSNKRAITTRPCLVDNNAAGVKAIEGLAHDRFVFFLWCQVPLIEYAGGVVPAVNKSAIEKIPVCYPELGEQQSIADCLTSIENQIADETDQLAALNAHKNGLMQQLFPSSAKVAS